MASFKVWYTRSLMEPQSIVTAEEFFKVELRVGKVESAEPLENSDKLIRLTVSFDPPSTPSSARQVRNVLTGLFPFYEPEHFVGKLFVFAYNLEPRKMAGELSEGMLLCTDSESGPKPLVAPDGSVEGDKLK